MTVVVEDLATPLAAGNGCSSSADGVVCGFDEVYGIFVDLGDGDDRLTTSGPLPVELNGYGGGGNDSLTAAGVKQAFLDRGGGADMLTVDVPTGSCAIDGASGDDILVGSAGQDRLYGGPGVDSLDAGAGPDYALGGEDGDEISSGPDDDIFVTGEGGNDTIDTGGGDDFIEESRGNDSALGGEGQDTLATIHDKPEGDDVFLGGSGRDALLRICGGCRMQLGTSRNGRRGTDETDRVVAEILVLRSLIPNDEELPPTTYGNGADLVVGDAAANVLRTERGSDRLAGGGGADKLRSGAGDDLIRSVDGGRDTAVDCGDGDDVAIVDRPHEPRGCERVIIR